MLSYSPDGHTIAYNRIFRNLELRKRYVGGQAQDIYLYNFTSRRLIRVTDWKGTDTSPMWSGTKVYFLWRPWRQIPEEHLVTLSRDKATKADNAFHRLRCRLAVAWRLDDYLPAGRPSVRA